MGAGDQAITGINRHLHHLGRFFVQAGQRPKSQSIGFTQVSKTGLQKQCGGRNQHGTLLLFKHRAGVHTHGEGAAAGFADPISVVKHLGNLGVAEVIDDIRTVADAHQLLTGNRQQLHVLNGHAPLDDIIAPILFNKLIRQLRHLIQGPFSALPQTARGLIIQSIVSEHVFVVVTPALDILTDDREVNLIFPFVGVYCFLCVGPERRGKVDQFIPRVQQAVGNRNGKIFVL